jgi:RNA polymerase sigma-70 factor, ECF subfamily
MADGDGPGGGGDDLVDALVAERPRLVGLAYRITGSRVDAEDIVQEAWERIGRVPPGSVERPAAWLTTVVSRLALDHLRADRRRRETYVGPWLPEPVVTDRGGRGPAGSLEEAAAAAASAATGAARPGTGGTDDPAELAALAESLTFGFLRVLESLAPVERAVFVLADVFGVPFPDIAHAVERSPEACRQIAARARRRVRADGRRHLAPPDAEQVARELAVALVGGEVDQVIDLLAPDVVLVSDGGAATRAARRPVVGPDRVARLVVNIAKRAVADGVRYERTRLNGLPGVVALVRDKPVLTMAVAVEDGRVSALYSVLNPEKLAALRLDGPIV